MNSTGLNYVGWLIHGCFSINMYYRTVICRSEDAEIQIWRASCKGTCRFYTEQGSQHLKTPSLFMGQLFISNKFTYINSSNFCLITKSYPTLLDCSLPGSSVHGICHTKRLEWGAISFSRGSSWLMNGNHISCTGRQVLYHWATREAQLI